MRRRTSTWASKIEGVGKCYNARLRGLDSWELVARAAEQPEVRGDVAELSGAEGSRLVEKG